MRQKMKFNVPVNNTDKMILLILAVLFLLGIRIVIGFFRKPVKRSDKEGKSESSGDAPLSK